MSCTNYNSLLILCTYYYINVSPPKKVFTFEDIFSKKSLIFNI
nr:MAG TPA: hypothetical protein [Caudoviricetes sp.]